ncbi:MAG: cupin domain-containing protein [Mycobacterium sp.]
MDGISLTTLAEEHLAAARSSRAGRSAHTLHGGHDHMLRQTLIALTGGTELAEHNSPGQATLQVLVGRVRVTAGADSWSGGPGDLLVLPRQRHGLHADTDAAVLLTVLADSREPQ